MSLNRDRVMWTLVSLFALSQLGCAEGPLWRLGHITPWARQQWAADEEIAETLFAKRRNLRRMVQEANDAGPDQQEKASQIIADIVRKDPVLLMRIEATKALAKLPTETATEALRFASQDPESSVRQASIWALEMKKDASAVAILSDLVTKDTNLDVRLDATRALGSFADDRAVGALATLLEDSNPALQVRATQSLERITGEKLGPDIVAWKDYIASKGLAGGERTAVAPGNDRMQ